MKEKVIDFLLYLALPNLYIQAHYGEAFRKAQIKQIAKDIHDIQKELSKLKGETK